MCIDTTQAYGNKEAIGSAITKCGLPLEALFLTIKIWRSGKDCSSIDEYLKKLGTDYIDLMLIHQPFNDYYDNMFFYSDGPKEIKASHFYHLDKEGKIVNTYKQITLLKFLQGEKESCLMTPTVDFEFYHKDVTGYDKKDRLILL